ncbi:MAG: hypothetical protein JJE42_09535, partial [Burkholderiales bacterium]|nr:hypothetical protein [Burkholderiales bacterium]
MWDSIWINAHLATLREGKYNAVRRGALAVAQGKIAWIGARTELPGEPAQLAREVPSRLALATAARDRCFDGDKAALDDV